MADIREFILFPLGTVGSSSGSYTDPLNSYDYSVAGVPFLSGITREEPAVIKSAEFRRTQIDQSTEPGEQSLTGWWVRSQQSFHGGAGLKYTDPALDPSASFRFNDSEGVNVWEPGQVTLLPESASVLAAGSDPALINGGRVDGTDIIVVGRGTAVRYITAAGAATTLTTTDASTPATAWAAMASDGQSFYLANDEGVWQVKFTTLVSYTYIKLWTLTPAGSRSLGWVKGRLMAGVGPVLFELIDPGGGAPHALPGTATYTSLVADFRWTSITAGPAAIYASGYSGNRGSILEISLDVDGALPTLTGATEVAQLPTGEWPLSIRAYLGTLMVIGTSKGVRIADINDGGGISYGPLIETENPVTDLIGIDRYAYATHTRGDRAGLLRVDLSLKFDNGRYAYANDIGAEVADLASGVALIGDSGRVAWSTVGGAVYFESTTDIEETGFLATAQTRYNTLWPKLFKRMSLRGSIQGEIEVYTIDTVGNEALLATLNDATDITEDLAINVPDTPQESLALKFVLNRASELAGSVFRGYQLKANPGGPRQHQYIIPLQCYDSEKDADGGVIGYPGYGMDRLQAIMAVESTGEVVLFQDLVSDLSVLVTIEEIEFRQIAPGGLGQSQWGGTLTLSMRTLE